MEFLKFHNYLIEVFRIDLRHFWAWLSPTNTPKVSESKYQAGFGVMISGQNPQTFMIPIYSTTVLYDIGIYLCKRQQRYEAMPNLGKNHAINFCIIKY